MKTIHKNHKSHQGSTFRLLPSFLPFCFLIPIVTGIAFSFTGCKKFIDIPPPTTQLVTTNVFNNNASATSAQISIYTEMFTNSESYYMAAPTGMYADELQNYSTIPIAVAVYENALEPVNFANWTPLYPSNNYYLFFQ